MWKLKQIKKLNYFTVNFTIFLTIYMRFKNIKDKLKTLEDFKNKYMK